ncbi:MAG: PilZ domain-containing protein [Oscillospiraceae bacterium]|nr:PilZ domain-containing protein [Oscillospiraceae bacterium]
MGLLGWFGKKAEKKSAAPAEKPAAASLAFCEGMRVEVTDAGDGRPLFQAELHSVRGAEAALETLRMDAEDLPASPADVLLRGYSKRESKAVLLEASITPDQEPSWRAENLVLRKAGNDRSYFRLGANLEAVAAAAASPKLEEACKLLDISAGGVRIAAKQTFRMGEQLILTVRLLPERETLRIFCRVLRIVHRENGRQEYGCQFLDLSDADQEKLTQMIFELQRLKKNMV